jgi:hypothetical protein
LLLSLFYYTKFILAILILGSLTVTLNVAHVGLA